MTYLLENINTAIAKIAECMARDPKRAERLLGDVKRWVGELAAPSQAAPSHAVSSQAEADAVFEAAQAGLPEIPFGPAFIDAYRKHYIAWGQQCFKAGMALAENYIDSLPPTPIRAGTTGDAIVSTDADGMLLAHPSSREPRS